MIRAFLSLTPDVDSAIAIQQWSALCWPAISRAVPLQNYHLTLAFLGDISDSQLQTIQELHDDFRHPVFDLKLDRVGYWPDSTTLWLGSTDVPEDLMSLVVKCKSIANRAGVGTDKRRYTPHLTLARKTQTPPGPPLIDPDFPVRFESVELYQSIMDRDGVRYVELNSWSLI